MRQDGEKTNHKRYTACTETVVSSNGVLLYTIDANRRLFLGRFEGLATMVIGGLLMVFPMCLDDIILLLLSQNAYGARA